MSSIRVEVTDQGFRFDIHETKPYGEPDVRRSEFVSYGCELNPRNDRPEFHLYWDAQNLRWIGYRFRSFPERSGGLPDEQYVGPYEVLNAPSPTNAEIEQAAQAGALVERRPYTRILRQASS